MDASSHVAAITSRCLSVFTSCSPELLRLAKRNSPDAAIPMWRCLHECMLFLLFSGGQVRQSVPGLRSSAASCFRDYDVSPLCDDDAWFMQYWMFQLRFPVVSFYSEPGLHRRSRSILLALAWILACSGLHAIGLSPVHDVSHAEPSPRPVSARLVLDAPVTSRAASSTNHAVHPDALIFAAGCLHVSQRRVRLAQRNIIHSIRAIHDVQSRASASAGALSALGPPLSPADLVLLCRKGRLDEEVARLERA